MTSASSVTGPSATGSELEASPADGLMALLERARLASEGMSATNPNRRLIADLCLVIITFAQENEAMKAALADKPRIILP